MNRQEPYIGMPIILGSFDDDREEIKRQSSSTLNPSPANAAHSTNEGQPAHAETASCAEARQPMMLAMAYVPWQKWKETYPLDEGLNKGTIFPELYLPFEGKRMGGSHR